MAWDNTNAIKRCERCGYLVVGKGDGAWRVDFEKHEGAKKAGLLEHLYEVTNCGCKERDAKLARDGVWTYDEILELCTNDRADLEGAKRFSLRCFTPEGTKLRFAFEYDTKGEATKALEEIVGLSCVRWAWVVGCE